ncbi:MAG: iron-sulfur cluster assembly accessory protein [Verrucomicrobiales bacterium]|jgi:iron-sulfur cluster assembly protein|nr:iron-sulfur cluster assembly accessory protein [Verrucomicrobiales bacterium]
MITVTDSAANHLRSLLEEKDFSPKERGLRLFVEKGGCAGMSYAMKIDALVDGDEVIEKNGVRVFVDPESGEYLKGIQLDYVDALNDSGFKIENPNAARSCGCGTSFEPTKEGQEPEYDPETMDGEVCGSTS